MGADEFTPARDLALPVSAWPRLGARLGEDPIRSRGASRSPASQDGRDDLHFATYCKMGTRIQSRGKESQNGGTASIGRITYESNVTDNG